MNERTSYIVTAPNGFWRIGDIVWLANQMSSTRQLSNKRMDIHFQTGRAVYARAASGLGGYITKRMAKVYVPVSENLELI